MRAGAEAAGDVPEKDRQRWVVPFLGVAFLLSGAAGLIHEVVWTRLLGHLFGVSSFAISTVLGAYMGGLALGSWWMGSRAERFRDQRRVYAWLELGIGAFALAVPAILALVEPLYGWVWRHSHLSFVVFSALRFFVAGSILLIPTFLMGATFPVLAEYLSRREGRRLAPEWLYTLNLAGAVGGVAVAGFGLLPGLGVRATIATGAALNIGVGLAVLLLPVALAPAPSGAVEDASGAAPAAAEARLARPRPGVRGLLLAAAFLSGLLSLATQVAWNRVLALVVGSTSYAFSAVLLVYLVSLGLGAALASRFALRARAAAALGLAFLSTALLTEVAVLAVGHLPDLYLTLYSVSETASLRGLVLRGLLAAISVLFPPVLAAGTILPLTLAAAAPHGARRTGTGAVVGEVYAVNTLGSISGSLLGGFTLIPLLGTQRTLLVLAGVAGAMGLACLHAIGPSRRLTVLRVAAGAVLAAGIVLPPGWNQSALHAGVFEPGYFEAGISAFRSQPRESVVFQRDGRTASVMVAELSGIRTMRIDARINASDHPGDMATQILLAQIPILLSPSPDEVFVVGWGSGVTAGAALQAPVEHLTVVELEPAVVEASRLFSRANHDPLADPRLLLYLDDARHILLAADRSFDVIISEPPHPWLVGVANLFTQDFYRLAAKRLEPDGVFAQWLQTYEMTLDTYRTILATFLSVFPEAIVFFTPGTPDTIVVGSRQPLALDLARLAERWRNPATRAELARAGLARPEHLLAAAVLAPADARALAAGAPLNTDDNMLVEFGAATGSLLLHELQPEIDARSSGPGGLALGTGRLVWSEEEVRAYVDGLRAVGRDPARYLAQFLANP